MKTDTNTHVCIQICCNAYVRRHACQQRRYRLYNRIIIKQIKYTIK